MMMMMVVVVLVMMVVVVVMVEVYHGLVSGGARSWQYKHALIT